MDVKFKSASEIKVKLGIEPHGAIHKAFANACRNHMNERYVPKEKRNLCNTSSNLAKSKYLYRYSL